MKQAATQRVFGFEIMPAPFVVAHLQVGLTMQALDAPLSDNSDERAGVFLTNALTGWEPRTQKPLPFPELEEERDRAERVKQDTPVLVILGNPPYNGFAGMAVDEERELSEAYRTTNQVRRPEGQGLNDLYVRFFRMAERWRTRGRSVRKNGNEGGDVIAPERVPGSGPVPSRSSALGNGAEARLLERCAECGASGIPDGHRIRQGDGSRGYLRLL